jgi:hypothetical protein
MRPSTGEPVGVNEIPMPLLSVLAVAVGSFRHSIDLVAEGRSDERSSPRRPRAL